MTSPFLLSLKALLPRFRKAYFFDDELVQSVQVLSGQDGQPVEEMAASLIAMALAQRHHTQETVRVWNTLTPREQQVAALICLRLRSPEIARRLGIAPETVRTHVRNLFSKFHLHTKLGLRLSMPASSGWDFAAWEAVDFDPRSAPSVLTKMTTDQRSIKVRYPS